MRWNDRQVAMLREMGIRVWARETSGTQDATAAGSDVLVAEEARPHVPEVRTTVPASVIRDQVPREARSPSASAPAPSHAPALAGAEWLIFGEPFDAVGSAGDPSAAADQERLLDNMLHAIRLSRAAPGREGRACYLPIAEGRPIDPDAAIARVDPRCIIVLGKAAAGLVLGLDDPLGRLRERVHERNGVPVVVTFALPYLLRHPVDKPKAWADLCRAVGLLA